MPAVVADDNTQGTQGKKETGALRRTSSRTSSFSHQLIFLPGGLKIVIHLRDEQTIHLLGRHKR